MASAFCVGSKDRVLSHPETNMTPLIQSLYLKLILQVINFLTRPHLPSESKAFE